MIIPIAIETLAIYLTYKHGKRLRKDYGNKFFVLPLIISAICVLFLVVELAGPIANALGSNSGGVMAILSKLLLAKKISLAANVNLFLGLYLMYKNNTF